MSKRGVGGGQGHPQPLPGWSMQVRDLGVDLGEFHLREIDLDVAAGEYFVILGPTGGGKTVLLEAIAGLHQLRKGQIMLDGEDVTGLPPEQRGMGFVYQDYMLFPHLSVAGNIAFGLELRDLRGLSDLGGLTRRQVIAERVAEMSQLLGIAHLMHRRPGTLSGGEAQRVALARALVVEPRLLLLDEPLSALDPGMREGLQRELGRLHRELCTTTIHVTHDFEEAVALGDRIAVVHAGRIVQVGSTEEIFRKPSTEFVARFVGVRNIFQGELHPGEDGYQMLSLNGIKIAVVTELSGRARASIRPEDIVLSQEPLRSSARNSFRSRIVDIADRGTVVYVTARVPGAGALRSDFICMITRRSLEEMGLREGLEVYIAFKTSAVHVF
ncbi:MAG: tungstate ABC transporter ATP-binding protein WtpC [Chloroflexota bacterium]|nr:tungstate ABC transporter ATP-binding protein WtpC [Chloroflexota bacterium]